MKNNKQKVIRAILIIVGIAAVIVFGLYVGDEKSRYWIDKNILGTSVEEEDLPKIEYEQDKKYRIYGIGVMRVFWNIIFCSDRKKGKHEDRPR